MSSELKMKLLHLGESKRENIKLLGCVSADLLGRIEELESRAAQRARDERQRPLQFHSRERKRRRQDRRR